MNKEELIKYICNKLNSGKDVEFEYQINGVPYKIKILAMWIWIEVLIYRVFLQYLYHQI